MSTRPLAITCGDPAGVGPELLTSWLQSHPELASTVVAIGPAAWIKKIKCPGIIVGPEEYTPLAGKPDQQGHAIALAAMEAAAQGMKEGRFRAVVTGPINKKGLSEVGFSFPGQTEFFAARWNGEPVMAFAGGKMSVGLVTWHIPLKDVSQHLTTAKVHRTILAMVQLCQKRGIAQPRVGVCGLNPHAGEGGLLGLEDDAVIRPVVEALRRDGHAITGPLSGDTVFYRHLKGEFDAVVAMYHDQGLAPLKTIDFETSANLSLGLPWVRTSPDHGTAYEIAGKGSCHRGSFEAAIQLALQLSA
jgi:4-hydroxythreonine-4-phosphate dehydrogenase